MELTVNGELKSVNGDALSVLDILKQLNVETPDMVSVQLNGKFVDKQTYPSILVKDKDEVEFLYFMGGGR